MKKLLLSTACVLGAIAMYAEDEVTSTPVTISEGFTVDAVAENPTQLYNDIENRKSYMDGHSSQLLVNDGMMVQGGIPSDGKITTASGNEYQLASFTEANDLYLETKGDEGTLVFEEPVAADQFGILMCATDGPEGCDPHPSYSAVINYEDGTTQVVEPRLVADWGCGHASAYKMSQRFRGDNAAIENCNLAMSEDVFTANPDLKVKSITFICETEPAMASWGEYCLGRFNILAVTAIANPAAIVTVAADNAEVEAIYDLSGMKLADYVNGINIVKYTNGKVSKVYVTK